MAFANPGLLGTQTAFKTRYANALDADSGISLETLRKRIAPFVLRRHKTDPGIADELPERIVVRDDCTLTREQAALYQAVVDDMRSDVADATGMKRRGKVLAGITKLKQICNHPATISPRRKTTTARASSRGVPASSTVWSQLAEEIIEEGEAVVVFSQYATFLRRVAEHLRTALDVGVENLDGKMSRVARDAAVERFSEVDGPPVLCVSLKAGGTGLNLVRANHVIHFDRWWNPAVEDQASDRVWRIGQTRGVVVHTLVCPGTLEERIADLLDQKRSLADAVVSSSPEQLISELDDAALAALVELDCRSRDGPAVTDADGTRGRANPGAGRPGSGDHRRPRSGPVGDDGDRRARRIRTSAPTSATGATSPHRRATFRNRGTASIRPKPLVGNETSTTLPAALAVRRRRRRPPPTARHRSPSSPTTRHRSAKRPARCRNRCRPR